MTSFYLLIYNLRPNRGITHLQHLTITLGLFFAYYGLIETCTPIRSVWTRGWGQKLPGKDAVCVALDYHPPFFQVLATWDSEEVFTQRIQTVVSGEVPFLF